MQQLHMYIVDKIFIAHAGFLSEVAYLSFE